MNTLTEFEAAYMAFMRTDMPPARAHESSPVTYKHQHANDLLRFWRVARTVTLPVDDNLMHEPGYAETLVAVSASLKAQGFIVK